MPKYLVLKILDSQSISLPSTLIYGEVELRSHDADFECELGVLRESAKENKIDFDKYLYSTRIATIVESDSSDEAIDISSNLFAKTLDLKSINFSISSSRVSDIGFVKNLESGVILPILNKEFGYSMSFHVHQGYIQQFDAVNYILSLKSELSERYLRSLHWIRNSKHEKNKQLKILFLWFSVEALFKESENDNICGVLRWFLGFPNDKGRKLISPSILNKLGEHESYEYWKKELNEVIDSIRVFRNNSVHSGFRMLDYTKQELELYYQVMQWSAFRCTGAVQHALINGINTVNEFKEYIPAIFESCINVNDVHGNILFSLDKNRE